MHEMLIAVEIVERAVALAEQHGAARIERIEVQLGAMRQVVPEALQMAFEAARTGTLAEGAELLTSEEAVAAVCNECGQHFEPDIEVSFACPRCSRADVRIVAGNDIILKSIVCQTDQEVAAR